MNKMLSEVLKVDTPLVQQLLSVAAIDTARCSLSRYSKALFVINVGVMLAAETVTAAAWEDGAAVAAQALSVGVAVPTAIALTITGNTNVAEATLTTVTGAGGTHTAADTVVINGLTFTAILAAGVMADRTYAHGATGEISAANLLALLNDPTWGIAPLGLTATIGGAGLIIILAATEPGEAVITVVSNVRNVARTVRAVAYLEVDNSYLSAGYTHVGVRFTSSVATVPGSVILLRGAGRYTPEQLVAASNTTRIIA